MKVVHIGLGKTGTTSLQKSVFPRIFDNYNKKELLESLDILLAQSFDLVKYNIFKDKFSSYKDVFISAESLVGWDPEQWSEMLNRNFVKHYVEN